MKNLKGILFIILIFLCVPILCAHDVEFPLIQSLAFYPFSEQETMAINASGLSLNLSYSNIYMFNHQSRTVNDMELFSTIIGYRYGLKKNLTVEFYLKLMWMNGGFLDPIIEKFHHLIGIVNDARDQYKQNSVHYEYKDFFFYNKNLLIVSPVVISFLNSIYSSAKISLKIRLAIGLPFKEKAGLSSGKPFYTAGLITSGSFQPFVFNLSTYLTLFPSPQWLADEKIKKYLFYSEFSIEWKRFLFGALYRSTPLLSHDLNNRAFQLYLGYRFGKNLYFSLVEEIPPMDTVPDVSFNLHIRIK